MSNFWNKVMKSRKAEQNNSVYFLLSNIKSVNMYFEYTYMSTFYMSDIVET